MRALLSPISRACSVSGYLRRTPTRRPPREVEPPLWQTGPRSRGSSSRARTGRDRERRLGLPLRGGANIVRSDQYTTDPEGGDFFMRMEYFLPCPAPTARRSSSDFATGRRAVRDGLAHVGHGAAQARGRSSSRARTTACSTCVALAPRLDGGRHRARRLEPRGPARRRRGLRHPLPARAGDEGDQAGVGGAAARAAGGQLSSWWCSPATCRSCRATSSSASACR